MANDNAKTVLDRIFPRENVSTIDGGAKVVAHELVNTQINQLSMVSQLYSINLKRSGTGINVTLKKR